MPGRRRIDRAGRARRLRGSGDQHLGDGGRAGRAFTLRVLAPGRAAVTGRVRPLPPGRPAAATVGRQGAVALVIPCSGPRLAASRNQRHPPCPSTHTAATPANTPHTAYTNIGTASCGEREE